MDVCVFIKSYLCLHMPRQLQRYSNSDSGSWVLIDLGMNCNGYNLTGTQLLFSLDKTYCIQCQFTVVSALNTTCFICYFTFLKCWLVSVTV